MPANVQIDTRELTTLRYWLRKITLQTPKRSRELNAEISRKFLALVKQNASGRPGPNVITGAYRDSIHIYKEVHGDGYDATWVGTAAPQAMRLELGFVGTDSLGRHYQQPAFPHWLPAMNWVWEEYQKEVSRMAIGLIGEYP